MKHKRKEKSKAEDSQRADDKEQKAQENKLEELYDKIESLQKEQDELFAKLQRVSADYANFQKRVPKQIGDTIGYEKERIIKTLLPVLDNFEHTLQNAHSAEDVDVLIMGIRIIYDQFLDILKSHNVEQIEALGEQFDPAMHQAMTQQTDPDKQENIVLEEFQKGYRLNGRVIRPSRVIVNKLPEEKPGDGQEGQPPEQPKDENDAADECESRDTE
jgi:molecular chaperone GrpE